MFYKIWENTEYIIILSNLRDSLLPKLMQEKLKYNIIIYSINYCSSSIQNEKLEPEKKNRHLEIALKKVDELWADKQRMEHIAFDD